MTLDQWIGIVSALASIVAVVLALTRPVELSPRAVARSIEMLVICVVSCLGFGYMLVSTIRSGDLLVPHGILVNPHLPPSFQKIYYFGLLYAICQGLVTWFVLVIIFVVRAFRRYRKWINESE